MNIGIIVFSNTGNTQSVAENLRDTLLAKSHKVVLEKVTATNNVEMDPKKVMLINSPSTQGYDMLVFAAPVYGGRLPAAMQVYLQGLPSLEGKLAAGFVTQAFPFASWGGNQAIRGLEALMQAKSGKLSTTGVINWTFAGRRKTLTAETIEKIVAILG